MFGGGSLDVGGSGGGSCAIPQFEGIVTSHDVSNKGQLPLTLTSVRLFEPQGVRLLESSVIPGHSGIGVMNFPMDKDFVKESGWDHRKPVKGYVLDAGAKVEIELAAGLEPGQRKGSYSEYVVDYVDAFGFPRSAHAGDQLLYLQSSGDCPEDTDDWE